MAKENVKLLAITTVIFALFSIIFFGLSVTSIGKYRAQRERVHHMEQKIVAGKKEILKVPETIGKLRIADKEKQELEVELAELTETNEELNTEFNELQKEYTVLTIAKAVLDTEKAGYTKNLIEARQAVEELRKKSGSAYRGIDTPEKDLSAETTPDDTKEEIPLKNVWE
ncbi:MAG: hypothetical protein ACE5KZ_14805 [Candidatus Scalinduaceae bacterium]